NPLSAPRPDQRGVDGSLVGVDARTPDQRRADAITEIARAAGAYLNFPHPQHNNPNSSDSDRTGGTDSAEASGAIEGMGSSEAGNGRSAEDGDGGSAGDGSAGDGSGWVHPEMDARAQAVAAAAQAEDLFSLTPTHDTTHTDQDADNGTGTDTGTGTGTGADSGPGPGTETGFGPETETVTGTGPGTGRGSGGTRCGPSKAGRLRPGRRPARITITTTFDQLRSFPDKDAAILRQTLGNQPKPAEPPAPPQPPEPLEPLELPELLESPEPGAQLALTVGPVPAAPQTPADPDAEDHGSPAEPSDLPSGWTDPDGVEEDSGWPGGVGPENTSVGWDTTTSTTDSSTNDSTTSPGSSWFFGSEPEVLPEQGLSGAGGLTPLDPMPSWCDGLGSISPGTLARMVCDASFERAVLGTNGAVLDLGTAVRLATPAQRRAVSVRDGGCVRPGCNRPASWCDIHHVIWYSRGGPTAVSNMCALCPSCHSLVHAGILEVRPYGFVRQVVRSPFSHD
ncbi:HNH endonuclease, partial [Paeniglutamicibacter antarcticus]